ncbi:DUF6968 family protein [Massilia antarctica]|uniref:DUF6968 family protein n=1 Tax=Massilia antarctica TaxID=2765360 RepID=UPI0035A5F41F
MHGSQLAVLVVKQIQKVNEATMFYERTLFFTPSTGSGGRIITVKIGTPYFPAKTDGMEMFYACPVQLGTTSSASEAFGIDHMQALGGALSIIHIYLRELCEGGELRWTDGRLYNHKHECPIPLENQINVRLSKEKINFE